jgi:hypothetical protein
MCRRRGATGCAEGQRRIPAALKLLPRRPDRASAGALDRETGNPDKLSITENVIASVVKTCLKSVEEII